MLYTMAERKLTLLTLGTNSCNALILSAILSRRNCNKRRKYPIIYFYFQIMQFHYCIKPNHAIIQIKPEKVYSFAIIMNVKRFRHDCYPQGTKTEIFYSYQKQNVLLINPRIHPFTRIIRENPYKSTNSKTILWNQLCIPALLCCVGPLLGLVQLVPLAELQVDEALQELYLSLTAHENPVKVKR